MTVSPCGEADSARIKLPIQGGTFIAVVGPSGAGKDTIISYGRTAYAGDSRVHFVRRVVTRPSDSAVEDHETLEDAAFERAEASGAFALSWSAHGLKYGIPAAVDDVIRAGGTAVANMSRNLIPAVRARYAGVAVVHVTASAEVLARRLSARGRESSPQVLARLARSGEFACELGESIVIENNGAPDIAGERFVRLIRDRISRRS